MIRRRAFVVKQCQMCGCEFYPREDEPTAIYKRRKTCSQSCNLLQQQKSRDAAKPVRSWLPRGFVERFAAHNGLTVEAAAKLLEVRP